MNYKVNPVKGTCFKYKNKNPGLVGLMDSCMDLCSVFSGTTDVYQMDPVCTATCDAYIEKKKHEMFGVGSCDKQSPYRPVIWRDVPRFVPQLLRSGKSLTEAVNACPELCNKYAGNNVAECINYCSIDASAVEEYPNPSTTKASPSLVESDCSTCKGKGGMVVQTTLLVILAIVLLIFFIYKMKY